MKCKKLKKINKGDEALDPKSRIKTISVGGVDSEKEDHGFTSFDVGPLPSCETAAVYDGIAKLAKGVFAPADSAVSLLDSLKESHGDTKIDDLTDAVFFGSFDESVDNGLSRLRRIFGKDQAEALQDVMVAATGIDKGYWENSDIRQILCAIFKVVAINFPLSGLPDSMTEDIDNALGFAGLSIQTITEHAKKVGGGMLSGLGSQDSPVGELLKSFSENPDSVENMLAALRSGGVGLPETSADQTVEDLPTGAPVKTPTSTSKDSPL